MTDEEKDIKTLGDIKALVDSDGRNILRGYINGYKNGYVEKLIVELGKDFDKKFSSHDVYRLMIRYLEKLDNLPNIIINGLERNDIDFDELDVLGIEKN